MNDQSNDAKTGTNAAGRKTWQTPQVIHASVNDTEAGIDPTNETIDTLNGGPS